VPDYRERAWNEILELLPAGWHATPPCHDPADGLWHVTAVGPKKGGRRGPPPESIVGDGLEEESALVDLVLKLRELDKADHLEALWRRVRLAYYQGAEEQANRNLARPLTGAEVERAIKHLRSLADPEGLTDGLRVLPGPGRQVALAVRRRERPDPSRRQESRSPRRATRSGRSRSSSARSNGRPFPRPSRTTAGRREVTVALVAFHFPRAEHREELVGRVQRAAEVMLTVDGCTRAEVWVDRASGAIVTTGEWQTEAARRATFEAVAAADVDFDYDEREERPREVYVLDSA
jgi:quinol monooxygenase YgiN